MYTLKVGSVYLAPRHSIRVEESSDFERFADEEIQCGGAGCSTSSKREFTFRLYFIGNGSLASAWALRSQLEQELIKACDEQILLYRKVRDEAALVYQINSSQIKMIDTVTQFTCERMIIVELTLTVKSASLTESPLLVGVSFPKLDVGLVSNVAASPLLVGSTLIAPTLAMELAALTPLQVAITFPTMLAFSSPSPLAVAARFVTPTVLVGGDVILSHSYIGYNTIGASQEAVTNGRVYLKKVTIAADGVLTSIGAYYDMPSTAGTHQTGVVVHADVAGAVGEPIAHSPCIDVSGTGLVTATSNAQWRHMPMGLFLPAGDYWIGIMFRGDGVAPDLYYDAGADRIYTSGDVYFASPTVHADSDSTRQYSIRGSFLVTT